MEGNITYIFRKLANYCILWNENGFFYILFRITVDFFIHRLV